jgi:hypothetical protein
MAEEFPTKVTPGSVTEGFFIALAIIAILYFLCQLFPAQAQWIAQHLG